MRRLLSALCIVALAVLPARADFGAGNGLMGFWAFQSKGVTIEYLGSATNTASGTSYTYSSFTLGAEAADRVIVVAMQGYQNPAPTPNTTATINGVTANRQVFARNTTGAATGSAIYSALVPTGTSGDIVIGFGTSTPAGSLIAVYRVTGLASETATDTTSDNTASSNAYSVSDLTIPAGGVGIGFASSAGGNDATWTWDWGGGAFTEDLDTSYVDSVRIKSTSSYSLVAGTPTLTVTASSTVGNGEAIWAAWGP